MELKVYDIRSVSAEKYESWLSQLKVAQQNQIRGLSTNIGRVRATVVAHFIRQICGEREILRTARGKPYAVGGIEFNVSHSDYMVACVWDMCPVGIDIQRIKPIRRRLASRFCTTDEWNYLTMGQILEDEFITDPKMLDKAFRIWTGKEAWYKYTGEGWNEFPGINTLTFPEEVREWYTQYDEYMICVCGETRQMSFFDRDENAVITNMLKNDV